jgi:four helix bundle protein
MNRDSTGEGNRETGEGRRQKGGGKEGEESTPNLQPGRIQRFEDLIVWQRAVELAADVYSTAGTIRDLAFRDQLQRSAVSISSNIAEGYERDSNADFVRFLYYSKGSCGELRSQLHLARRLGLAAAQVADRMIEQASLLSRQLGAYINVRETKFQ